MTQEKQLLLKDLCARLPYGVRYKGDGGWGINPYQHTTSLGIILLSEEPLVYLRPMSSMTEEERNEYFDFRNQELQRVAFAEVGRESAIAEISDWLNAHHFDYRGLIENGLALEAPDCMYKIE